MAERFGASSGRLAHKTSKLKSAPAIEHLGDGRRVRYRKHA
jgi:hypothetical protein